MGSIETPKWAARHHNVLRPEVAERIEARIRTRYFDGLFFATPCQSYSIPRPPVSLNPTHHAEKRTLRSTPDRIPTRSEPHQADSADRPD